MALQFFVGPWPLLQFRNLFYTDGRTAWTCDCRNPLEALFQYLLGVAVEIHVKLLSG
jgi:hypothetical protein